MRRLTQDAQDLWRHAPQRSRTVVQVVVLLAAVVLAYNYTFATLVQNAGLETPLAYVSLVPLIALALAAVNARPVRREPAIYDRQLDYIVGLPLLGGALAVNVFLPSRLSAMFWVWRIDLLTLPFFVAGCVAIIFGVRVMWRQRLAIGFLFLGWPYPYQSVLLRVLDAFTNATLFAVNQIVKVVHFAAPTVSQNGTLFVVVHNGKSFTMSIVSACSGVNSVVGFLLVGSAFGAVVRGPRIRKSLWLAGGMVLLWVLNLARITFLFWAGRIWGERVALDVLHPFIGLALFSVGVLVMVLLIETLGMHIGIEARSASKDVPPSPVSRIMARRVTLAVPKVYTAIAVAVAFAVLLGISNVGLKSYNLVVDASGRPKLDAYIAAPVGAQGWHYRRVASFNWAKPLFGDSSMWDRYVLKATLRANLYTTQSVVADVIVTPDVGTFSAYGVEACYQFHGYALRDVAQVSLGGGITGQSMSYSTSGYGSWSIVYWIIPVKLGSATTYERVVLYVQDQGTGVEVPTLARQGGIENVAGSLGYSDAALIRNRTFLVAFARQLIESESARSALPVTTNVGNRLSGGARL